MYFIIFFLGLWLPITDPTESCYVLTAKEMLESGDYFSPRIYEKFWYDKPIFFYWELILAFKIFGINEYAARFFPATFATIGVILTYYFAKRMYNREVGQKSAIILSTAPAYWYVAHAVITDMTLFCAISTTLMTFYFGYSEKRYQLYAISYASAGVAVLTKGPIGFFLPGLIILIFLISEKNLTHLKELINWRIVIFLAIALSWYLPMYIIHGQPFILNFFGVHNYLRATVSEHPQYNVWYYYIVIFLIGMLPWLPAKIKKPFDRRKRFLIIWAATVFLVFQAFATKYPTYTLPYMMPLAILLSEISLEKVKKIALRTAIILSILTIIATPICKWNSGKEIAEKIKNYDGCLVSYRKIYSGSLVFYSGKKIYRLESKEKIKKLKPQQMSWTSLNVMPFISPEELPKKVLAIVDIEKEEEFKTLTKRKWREIDEESGTKIMEEK